jgi:SAM-dependent methyltransferase
MRKTKHLDIGCGSKPRNPFNYDELYGIDIIAQSTDNFNYTQSNVVLDPLPFNDSTFDSVSAYDFLEHIPRFAVINNRAQFPFINFMNEVYRVLKSDGIFYAITPCYPRAEAFVDPTHINFISRKTHTYFTTPNPGALVYGFNGKFDIIKVKRIKFSQGIDKNYSWIVKLIKNIVYTIYYTKKSHILWELKAVKN